MIPQYPHSHTLPLKVRAQQGKNILWRKMDHCSQLLCYAMNGPGYGAIVSYQDYEHLKDSPELAAAVSQIRDAMQEEIDQSPKLVFKN